MDGIFFSRPEALDRGSGLYSRWMVPPAALAIHLSVGQVYAFSVFVIPLTRLLGVDKSGPGDWKQSDVAWIFSIAIALSG